MASTMASSSITGMFSKLNLGRKQRSPFTSNGTSSKLVMKNTRTFHVEVSVGDSEPADNAVRRFRKAVLSSNLVPECRRRRYFENPQDEKKRRTKDAQMRRKSKFANKVVTFEEVVGTAEPAPFSDLFGDPEDIFADVGLFGESQATAAV